MARSERGIADELDIDSMDFLNLVTALAERLAIDIPETDYPELANARPSGRLSPETGARRHGRDAPQSSPSPITAAPRLWVGLLLNRPRCLSPMRLWHPAV